MDVREYLYPPTARIRTATGLGTLDVTPPARAIQGARAPVLERGNLGDHKSVGGWRLGGPRSRSGRGIAIYFGKDEDSRSSSCCSAAPRRHSAGTSGKSAGILDATIWRQSAMARRSEDWNVGLAHDLQRPDVRARVPARRGRGRRVPFRSRSAR